jgi:Domain of unknown function (DUF5666)
MRSRISIITFAILLVSSLAQAQSSTGWKGAGDIRNGIRGSIVGRVVDVDASRNHLDLVADADPRDVVVRVTTDSLQTQYRGFGATQADVFTGTTGFSRIQIGDRIEVQGAGLADATVAADLITLAGRAAGTTAARPAGPLQGVVRGVAPPENRFVIETDDRQLYTIIGTPSTPVNYEGKTYQIRNIEVGDRIRVDLQPSTAGEPLRPRSIDVLVSAPQRGGTPTRTVAMLAGRVSRVDARTNSFRIRTDTDTEIRIDAGSAQGADGRPFRASDLHVGDPVEVSGTYGTTDVFRASTVRLTNVRGGTRVPSTGTAESLVTVVIYGAVRQDLREADHLVVRDAESKRDYEVWVDADLVVRTRTGTYTTADQLKSGDRLVLKAFRDAELRYIAQTIRLR